MLCFHKLIAMSVGKEISFTLPKILESKADPLYFPPIYSSRIYDIELIINLDFPIHNGGVNGVGRRVHFVAALALFKELSWKPHLMRFAFTHKASLAESGFGERGISLGILMLLVTLG